MILIVTNAEDPEADTVIDFLKEDKTEYWRFNTEDFPEKVKASFKLGEGEFLPPDGRVIPFSSITSAWYRRPEDSRFQALLTPEAIEFARMETRALLFGIWRTINCFWVSHPDNIRIAESKPLQLQVASSLGLEIPPTIITNDSEKVKRFCKDFGGDIIVKPIRRGYVEFKNKEGMPDVLSIFTNRVTPEAMREIDSLVYAPAIFQPYILKAFELRIAVVGTEVLACRIDSQESEFTRDDWRRYDFEHTPHSVFELPQRIEILCVELVNKLKLAFGAIDMIVTPDNRYVFLEINPNGHWLWIEELTGLPIARSMATLLERRVEAR